MRLAFLTTAAMVAFAGNSLLCRLALKATGIDPATFTSVRLASGAAALWLIVRVRHAPPSALGAGDWPSAFWLFAYAAGFSFAYVSLPAGMGALLLFGSVQATMIGQGLWNGERLRALQVLGLALAFAGLAALLLPGASAPEPLGAALMIFAGFSWGRYSLRGKGASDPTRVTAGNFMRAVPFALLVSAVLASRAAVDPPGVLYAIASGVVTSGVGYAIWYTALRELKATIAATVQLSVPAIAAAGGVLFVGEALTPRLAGCSAAILGGVAIVVLARRRA